MTRHRTIGLRCAAALATLGLAACPDDGETVTDESDTAGEATTPSTPTDDPIVQEAFDDALEAAVQELEESAEGEVGSDFAPEDADEVLRSLEMELELLGGGELPGIPGAAGADDDGH